MANSEFYTYVHRKADTGEVFYVGKGKGQRAYTKFNRTKYWAHVVAKHGLIVEIVANWVHEHEALANEVALIAEYRTTGIRLVNLTDGGEGASGQVFTAERRKKMSAAMLGKQIPVDVRLKISATLMGRKMPRRSVEHQEKLAAARRGKPLSEEHKKKISESRKNYVCSIETRKKISASGIGRAHSDDAIQKIRAANIGNTHSLGVKRSEETKQKMRDAQLGRVISEGVRANMRLGALTRPAISDETRAKMSVAHKAAWAARKAAKAQQQ